MGRDPWPLREGAMFWPPAREPKDASRAVTVSERPEPALLGGVLCPVAKPRRSSEVADGAGESCNGGTLKGCPLLFRKGLLSTHAWPADLPAGGMAPMSLTR